MRYNLLSQLSIAALGALLVSCSDISINFYPDLGNGGVTPESNKPTALVTFSASVEGRNLSRSLSALGKNTQVQLFAFGSTVTPQTGVATAQGLYQTLTAGVLTGVGGYKMYLSNGLYNFYGVSESLSLSALTFNNGLSEPLFNGVDYLWWTLAGHDVSASQVNIPIVLLHSATQVVFDVAAGEGITINELTMAHIWASKPGAAMTLSTGIITPTTTYHSQVSKMGINSLRAQYIMLPIRSAEPLQVSFDVRVNGEATSRSYSVALPLPNGELVAGDSYRFKAIIQANHVEFPQVSVQSWIDVDQRGKPIYATQ
ncbi:MAG: fimbrillin family protein [Mucinivorans sp.]